MTAPTLTLSEFLLARIAEDEDWVRNAGNDFVPQWQPDSTTRISAECEAKRRIVAIHWLREWDGWTYCNECNTTEGGTIYDAGKAGPCPTLRLLTAPFADHPDYNPKWRA